MNSPGLWLRLVGTLLFCVQTALAANYPLPIQTAGDHMLAATFRAETAKLSTNCLAEIQSLDDWKARRPEYRRELMDMLGLNPPPPRGDLRATITGKLERDDYTVENLHFQSLPGLYVTANLYVPKNLSKPAPTILYLNGHGGVTSNGVSYGNKALYQHYGAWFARSGYVCLVVDTLQLGEILGLHHGTYREGMWWWNSRGYTPAGVEAWNCVRALDYLGTRPEVDANRFGATGRSGGGAYSWWIAAIDDRIKAVAPTAGITDLHNHVIDGTVEGHCDCMFIVNTRRWDYAQIAALVAPRPLLIVNTDADTIFPLDGVARVHAQTRRIYELFGASTNLGLVIAPGPHKDTQDLQVPVFRWFNAHLKGEDPTVDLAADKRFSPQELKVFTALPADALNTNIHATFVPQAPKPAVPASRTDWVAQAAKWKQELKTRSFAGWPADPGPLLAERRFVRNASGLTLEAYDFDSEPTMRLRLYALSHTGVAKPRRISAKLLDAARWRNEFARLRSVFGDALVEEARFLTNTPAVDVAVAVEALRHAINEAGGPVVLIAPRGVGLNAWSADQRREIQIRRRHMLLGQTLDSMRAWDIRRACQAIQLIPSFDGVPLRLDASGTTAVNAMIAALFEASIGALNLRHPPSAFEKGPDYLNVLRVVDVPGLLALVADRCAVNLVTSELREWEFATKTTALPGGHGALVIREERAEPAR